MDDTCGDMFGLLASLAWTKMYTVRVCVCVCVRACGGCRRPWLALFPVAWALWMPPKAPSLSLLLDRLCLLSCYHQAQLHLQRYMYMLLNPTTTISLTIHFLCHFLLSWMFVFWDIFSISKQRKKLIKTARSLDFCCLHLLVCFCSHANNRLVSLLSYNRNFVQKVCGNFHTL